LIGFWTLFNSFIKTFNNTLMTLGISLKIKNLKVIFHGTFTINGKIF
jgi:hypothetical protein